MVLLKQKWLYDTECVPAPGKIKKVVYKNKTFLESAEISDDLKSWMGSDAGKFVWEKSYPKPTLHKLLNHEDFSYTIAVVGYFDEKDYILYNLKF